MLEEPTRRARHGETSPSVLDGQERQVHQVPLSSQHSSRLLGPAGPTSFGPLRPQATKVAPKGIPLEWLRLGKSAVRPKLRQER